MNRANRKKQAFKAKVRYLYKEYRFLLLVGVATFWVTMGILFFNIFTGYGRQEWDIENIVDADYSAVVKHETDAERAFIQVSGDVETNDLITLFDGTTRFYGFKMPLYEVKEGIELNERSDFFEDGLLSRLTWGTENRVNVLRYQDIPIIPADVTAVDDWDIDENESDLIGETLVLRGYINPQASNTQAVAQLRGLTDMMDDMNKDNEEANQTAYLFDFQHGDVRLQFHTDYPRVLGNEEVYIVNHSKN